MRVLVTLLMILVPSVASVCQDRVTSTYNQLIVRAKQEFIVMTPELIVDTLIMESRSTIRFTSCYNRVLVRHAIIGKNCKWVGRCPQDGLSLHGKHGASMEIEISFLRLGRLSLDFSGEKGAAGIEGAPGAPGSDGTTNSARGQNGGRGGNGGNGGHGGDVIFRYRSLGEPVEFSNSKKNAVFIQLDGGFGGNGGPGGPGGPGGLTSLLHQTSRNPAPVGAPGNQGPGGMSGFKGRPGKLQIVKLQ